jgi:C-terminal processing protease CtpA/Prc
MKGGGIPRKAPGFLGASVLAACLSASAAPEVAGSVPPDTLSFEAPPPARSGADGAPGGWFWNPPGTAYLDSATVHGGRFAVRLERAASSPGEFSLVSRVIRVDFKGDSLELRGWLKLDGVVGFAGLWLREDGPSGMVQFDNMEDRKLAGSRSWTEYRIALPLDEQAQEVYFGALLAGQGTARVDDLQLLVDGKPLAEAPPLVRTPTPAEMDHEFDQGSRITVTKLSSLQVENLVLLARVWGFLKYHHPRVTSAQVNWDFDLFRVLPTVLQASTHTAAIGTLIRWVDRLVTPARCEPCATLPDSLALRPRIEWISDRTLLGDSLSHALQVVYRNRPAKGHPYYASLAQRVGNPDFSNEAAYADLRIPDAGYRLLALFRFWNMIEYWYPYRDLLGGDWDTVLEEFIPRVVAAETAEEYRLAMLALVARVNDSHANVWSAIDTRPPSGPCQRPVLIRPVEGHMVVGGYPDSLGVIPDALKIGDAITRLDGLPVDSLAGAWAPYYGASNGSARERDIAESLTRGPCGPCRVTIDRAGVTLDLTASRTPRSTAARPTPRAHELPGPTVQLLSKDVAYIRVSSLRAADVPSYIQRAESTRCLVVDVRSYPSDFVVFALAGHFVGKLTPFVRFTHGDEANPGAFVWMNPFMLRPLPPYYGGRVVILVDEGTQSAAEYTAMGLRAAPNAIVVGSTTAGADGNVSAVPLPGGLRALITGLGVFYPDRRPTQQVGIVPDLVVRPTVQGLQSGHDEVAEAALLQVLGRRVIVSTDADEGGPW